MVALGDGHGHGSGDGGNLLPGGKIVEAGTRFAVADQGHRLVQQAAELDLVRRGRLRSRDPLAADGGGSEGDRLERQLGEVMLAPYRERKSGVSGRRGTVRVE